MTQPTKTETNSEGPEPIPVSALQHFSYCPRQYALIHIEQVFEDNVSTLRGQNAHARVDIPMERQERGVKVFRGLRIGSEALGLVGRADVVELLADDTLYPIEYKLGKHRTLIHDELQLAAQAMCLEEMMGRPALRGAIYSVESKQRQEVAIDAHLRQRVLETIAEIRAVQAQTTLPAPVNDKRCRDCSLNQLCQPELLGALSHQPEAAWRKVFEARD